jgi:hypothetical protein
MEKCIKCGSEKVVAGKMSGFAGVQIEKTDCKWYQLNVTSFIPQPLACMDCGHIELVISEKDLIEAKKITKN